MEYAAPEDGNIPEVADDIGRLRMCFTMKERGEMLRDRFGATFYKDPKDFYIFRDLAKSSHTAAVRQTSVNETKYNLLGILFRSLVHTSIRVNTRIGFVSIVCTHYDRLIRYRVPDSQTGSPPTTRLTQSDSLASIKPFLRI